MTGLQHLTWLYESQSSLENIAIAMPLYVLLAATRYSLAVVRYTLSCVCWRPSATLSPSRPSTACFKGHPLLVACMLYSGHPLFVCL